MVDLYNLNLRDKFVHDNDVYFVSGEEINSKIECTKIGFLVDKEFTPVSPYIQIFAADTAVQPAILTVANVE